MRNVAGQTAALHAADLETDHLIASTLLEVGPLRLQDQGARIVRWHQEHGAGFGFQQAMEASSDDLIRLPPVMAQHTLKDLITGVKQFQQLCVRYRFVHARIWRQ
jgi:hypothetical protein